METKDKPGPQEKSVRSKRSAVQYRMADPPDGGWGWVVVFSSFMIHVIADGVTYTFGIFYYEFLDYFGESKGATSWISSIMVGTTFCIGPIASGLTNKFGCRTVTIIGSLLAAFGLIISTFAPNVGYLYFTIGLCTGAGFGLMYLPAIVCVTCYFEKKRAFATGIAVCGSGIGTFLLAPLIQWMVAELGWKGAMLVVSGMVLNCCVFGALFRPLKQVPVTTEPLNMSISLDTPVANGNGFKDLRKGSLPIGTIGTNGEVNFGDVLKISNFQMSSLSVDRPGSRRNSTDPVRSSKSMTITGDHHHHSGSRRRSSTGPLSRKDIFYSGSIVNLPEYQSNPHVYSSIVLNASPNADADEDVDKKRRSIASYLCPSEMKEAFAQMMDFRLMGNVIFLMFGFSNFFTNIGFNVPFVYTKDRAVDMGISDKEYASYLLSTIGIANTVGRIILGYLSDKSCINRLWLYNGSLTLCGFATAFSSFCNSYGTMSLYASVFGATAGAYVSLTSVILVDLLGLEKLTNAFGLLLVFEGVSCLIGPPITGWLYDYTGSYDPGFFVSGIMIAFSGLMLFFIPCVRSWLKKNKENEFPMTQLDTSEKQENHGKTTV